MGWIAMGQRCIKGIGAYLPLLRLDRKAAARALAWTGLAAGKSGRRAVGGWDEDAATFAVEAARVSLPPGADVGNVIMATTSSPFFERSQAGLLVDALHLPSHVRTLDVGGSRRAAVSALLAALLDNTDTNTLIAAGERRPTKPGSALQLSWGDGGAAVLVGSEGGVHLLGYHSLSHDLVDVYSSRVHPTPYQSEERFIRDVTVGEILRPAITAALQTAGIAAGDISAAIVPEAVDGIYKALAGAIGLKAPNVAEKAAAVGGDLGTAHPLFALALALDAATAGDKLLLVGFGSGCDALVLEVRGPVHGAASASAAMTHGVVLDDYVRFLSLNGSLELDWGPRSELEQKTSASVLERYGRDMMGFIGGRDPSGISQFPKSRIPVAPGALAGQGVQDIRLADEIGKIVSITADRLNYSPDPPFHFGLVQFEGGARVLMEFTDIDRSSSPMVGDSVAMRFRIKSIDRRRGFRTYFWKAVPPQRPNLEN
ncbi:MAG TPA: 3-hydroxy-3-methylglutaryl CoA synthase [Beijerinckia sp.]|nr:3-hydroxy-3-methylglutaryl CoA synthase [Beijerinckia sp.]